MAIVLAALDNRWNLRNLRISFCVMASFGISCFEFVCSRAVYYKTGMNARINDERHLKQWITRRDWKGPAFPTGT